MSDLVKRDTDGWAEVMPAIADLATKISNTDFVPDSMRAKPAAVACAILYGRELGLEPMTALRSINVIKGKPSLSSEAMRALILAAGHELVFVETTLTRCVIDARRRGQENYSRVTYTMDDAKRAGLAGQGTYAKMPRQMLVARATAEMARLLFADVIGGLLADVEVDDIEAETPKRPSTTVQRKRAQALLPESEPVLEDTVPEPEPDEDEDIEILDAEIIDDTDTDEPTSVPVGPPVTKPQLAAIMTAFNACGITDREERLLLTARIIKRPDIASAQDLTTAEAGTLLSALEIARMSTNPADTLRGDNT